MQFGSASGSRTHSKCHFVTGPRRTRLRFLDIQFLLSHSQQFGGERRRSSDSAATSASAASGRRRRRRQPDEVKSEAVFCAAGMLRPAEISKARLLAYSLAYVAGRPRCRSIYWRRRCACETWSIRRRLGYVVAALTDPGMAPSSSSLPSTHCCSISRSLPSSPRQGALSLSLSGAHFIFPLKCHIFPLGTLFFPLNFWSHAASDRTHTAQIVFI